jgi:hypothetical protein
VVAVAGLCNDDNSDIVGWWYWQITRGVPVFELIRSMFIYIAAAAAKAPFHIYTNTEESD